MKNEGNAAIEIGNYVKNYIEAINRSFDELISLKNDHDKNVYRVVKEQVVNIRLHAAEKLIDDYLNTKFTEEEKTKFKISFEQACQKIIKHNLKEKALN